MKHFAQVAFEWGDLDDEAREFRELFFLPLNVICRMGQAMASLFAGSMLEPLLAEDDVMVFPFWIDILRLDICIVKYFCS